MYIKGFFVSFDLVTIEFLRNYLPEPKTKQEVLI